MKNIIQKVTFIGKKVTKRVSSAGLISVALIMLFVVFLPALTQPALASGVFRVTDGVHVREEPSTSSKSLTTVPQGTSVEVIEHNPDPADWSLVRVGNITGYIRSDFLKLSIGDTPAVFKVIAAAGVHLRETASTSAKSLATVTVGTNVDVSEHDPAGWSKVKIGDKTGYIKSDFLKHAGTGSSSSADGSSGTSGEGEGTGNLGERQTIGDDVNLRTGPSTTTQVIEKLKIGTTVTVLSDEANGWSNVVYKEKNGYIRSDLLGTAPAGGTSETEKTGPATIKHTTDRVNLRKSASTSSSIIRTLPVGTAVTVKSTNADGWSSVTVDGTDGFVSAEYLSDSPQQQEQSRVIGIYKTTTDVNIRTGPGVTYDKITAISPGTSVEVFANESNGWTRVRYKGHTGYIKSEYLQPGAEVEYVTMSEISHLLPYRQNIRVVDVRTGISYNIKIYSKGSHADYEPSTREDTEIMFSIRGGVRSWSARPLWIYVGDRIFAAATHAMPHDVTFISDNGMDGHLCLHFKDTVATSATYQADLRSCVKEAYDKRP